jgi:UDP-N-acetylglucosamine 2-epimerase (non-hydrolysing)
VSPRTPGTGKIAVVAGTRPEVIKLVPVVQALRATPGIQPLFISTGQHRQMLDQALAVFGEKPDLDLQVMSSTQTLHDVTTRALTGMRDVLERERPDWVVVQGDTVTAFAAALAAFYSRIPVAHVEAGLRSGDRHAPFPEEVNRRMVDQLSEVLFAPTADAAALLRAEGFAESSIQVTGNTVVDALLSVRAHLQKRPVPVPGLPDGLLAGRRMLLVTAHRRESFGDAFREMCLALRRIVDDAPDVCVVYPVHLNPNVDGPARALLAGHERIALLEPAGYAEFVTLLERAHIVLTDSGGVQEEAPTFAKPLLVLREVTERPEGIAAGVARLVGTSGARIHAETMRLLSDDAAYRRMASGHNPYGDGQAAQRIAQRLAEAVGVHHPVHRAA